MMKYLLLFFNWLKSALAKEILLTVLGILIALILSFITDKILEFSIKDANPNGLKTLQSELKSLNIERLEYWAYLFIFFMLMIYSIRFVEGVIKIVLIKKVEKG
jgi:hypothetical protein